MQVPLLVEPCHGASGTTRMQVPLSVTLAAVPVPVPVPVRVRVGASGPL